MYLCESDGGYFPNIQQLKVHKQTRFVSANFVHLLDFFAADLSRREKFGEFFLSVNW